jgi:hypothetical protein
MMYLATDQHVGSEADVVHRPIFLLHGEGRGRSARIVPCGAQFWLLKELGKAVVVVFVTISAIFTIWGLLFAIRGHLTKTCNRHDDNGQPAWHYHGVAGKDGLLLLPQLLKRPQKGRITVQFCESHPKYNGRHVGNFLVALLQ